MKKTIIAFMLFAVSSAAFAQQGKVALPFLGIPQNTAALSMGGAYLSSGENLGWFGNPAMMALSDYKADVSLAALDWTPTGTTYMDFSGAVKLGRAFALAAGASYGRGAEYDITSSVKDPVSSFRTSEMQAGIGAGVCFGRNFALGLNVAYVSQTLTEKSSLGTLAADIYMSARSGDFTATLGMENLGGRVAVQKNASTKYPLPTALAAGVAWNRIFAEIHRIELLADFDYYLSAASFGTQLGASYTWNGLASVRGGYHYGKFIPSFASAGLGVSVFGVKLDFTYLIAGKDNPLRNTLAFTLGYRF